jgi:hypothetical protein
LAISEISVNKNIWAMLFFLARNTSRRLQKSALIPKPIGSAYIGRIGASCRDGRSIGRPFLTGSLTPDLANQAGRRRGITGAVWIGWVIRKPGRRRSCAPLGDEAIYNVLQG